MGIGAAVRLWDLGWGGGEGGFYFGGCVTVQFFPEESELWARSSWELVPCAGGGTKVQKLSV